MTPKQIGRASDLLVAIESLHFLLKEGEGKGALERLINPLAERHLVSELLGRQFQSAIKQAITIAAQELKDMGVEI